MSLLTRDSVNLLGEICVQIFEGVGKRALLLPHYLLLLEWGRKIADGFAITPAYLARANELLRRYESNDPA